MRKIKCICEVCGKEEILTEEEVYLHGWDYPPVMGTYGVVSPRTCPECPMSKTLWWDLVQNKKPFQQLSEKQKETLKRIMQEPKNIFVEE